MRIAFDHQIFGWQVYGGISRYICELARGLAIDLRQEVRVIAPLFINQHLLGIVKEIPVVGRLVPRLPNGGRIYRRINALLAAPHLHDFLPDIVHETYYSASRHAPKGAKVVLTVHDMIHERFSSPFSWLDPTRREKAQAVARADHIICVSEHTRRDLLELMDVDPAKTSVVCHGLSQQPMMAADLRSCVRPFLLYVGHRGRYKNFTGLLQAYAMSPLLRREFDLVCFGGSSFTGAELRMVRNLALREGSVRQISGSDAVLTALYHSAHAFIYPSLYEGFGIPPLEAMRMNCPVACSNVSSIPEVVGDAAVMFDPHEVESVRAVIERLVGDESLRQSLIVRGRKRIEAFSWGRCARETLAVYNQVLGYG